jgi:hypothetical protein
MASESLGEFEIEPPSTCTLSAVFAGPESTPSALEEEAPDGSCARGILCSIVLEVAIALCLYGLWQLRHIHW